MTGARASGLIEEDIRQLSETLGLLPIHRVLLGHDGSMTKLLELIVCEEVKLETIWQKIVPCPAEHAGILRLPVGEPTNERDILILTRLGGTPLLHARSYTPLSRLKPAFKEDLMRADIPIGKIMQRYQIEARREILEVGCLNVDPRLADLLKQEGPYLWRRYNIISAGFPLITLKETFPLSRFGDPMSSESS